MKSSKKLPLFFVHSGFQEYLEYSLRHNIRMNPNCRVILLGDDTNEHLNTLENLEFYPMKDYFGSATNFGSLYTHMSYNPYAFELICIQRWFIIHDFMTTHKLDFVVYLDSDTLTFSDLNIHLSQQKNSSYDFMGINHLADHIAPTLMYFSYSFINGLINFINLSYENKSIQNNTLKEIWNEYKRLNQSGGICDMALLKLYIDTLDPSQLFNLTDLNLNTSIPDQRINIAEHYYAGDKRYNFEMSVSGFSKKIVFINGVPNGVATHENKTKYIPFLSLHFQSRAKKLIKFVAEFYLNSLENNVSVLDLDLYFELDYAKSRIENLEHFIQNIKGSKIYKIIRGFKKIIKFIFRNPFKKI